MSIAYSFDRADVDVDAVWTLLRASYWSPGIRREVVERAIEHSLVISALDHADGPAEGGSGRRLVGFARLVTDRATFAWLCDVVVVEEWRGRGIGREMVRRLMAHPDVATLRRFCLATRDAHGVYAPLGFGPVPPDRWMEHRPDPARWAEDKDRGVPS